MNARYRVKIRTIDEPKGSRIVQKEVAIIYRELEINGTVIDVPHPINSYLMNMYNKINSQKTTANLIKDFFNFIEDEIDKNNDKFEELKCRGISGLNWNHAAEYLRYCINIKQNSSTTAKQKSKGIIRFYRYLIESEVLDEGVKLTIVPILNEKTGNIIESYMSPFKINSENKVIFPEEGEQNKMKDLDVKLWREFLKISKRYYPEMTFGIYLQMMGGLRAGEVVNLTIDSLDLDTENEELCVNIKDRTEELFEGRDIRLDSSRVKKTRANQVVLNPYGDLMQLYKDHIKYITDIKDKTKSEFPNALFVSKRGIPLSGDNYKDRFYKIKKEFLEYLSENSYADYHKLTQKKWGTHIGRGIFTNFILNNGLADGPDGQPIARFVADLRGDKSSKSSKDYIEKTTLVKNVREKTKNLKSNLINIEKI